MSKFNKDVKTNRTVNRAGGEAFVQDARHQLVGLLLNSMLQDQYYRKEGEQIAELVDLVERNDKEFVAKAAIYARNEYGMRSISHVAAGEIGRLVSGERWTKHFFRKIARRPDDITEILAYFLHNHAGTSASGKTHKLPKAMEKGFALRLAEYDAYQLAKYRGEGKVVSLVDAVNLCHPKHTPQLGKLVAGDLVSKDTWEARQTKAGQEAKTKEEKAEKKAENWAELVRERKLGYFALLRNLRNIAQQAPDVLEEALVMLCDEKLIRKSLVLPFRYTTAFEATAPLQDRRIASALSKALDISVANVPRMEGRTLVAIDASSSMTWDERLAPIAALFGAILYKANDADLLLFHGRAMGLTPDPNSSVLGIRNEIMSNIHGGSTDFRLIFDNAQKQYARVVILSDMQAWVGGRAPTSQLAAYSVKYEANPFVYCFDLAGYGSMQFPADRIFQLFGFSEKVFDVMALMETDRNALINKIEAVTFD